MSETTNIKLFKHDNPATNQSLFDVAKSLNENWDKIDEYVTKQEATREENEKTRIANETQRKLDEITRQEAENLRTASEENRKKAEETRQTNEEVRRSAEDSRIENEGIRDTAEQERIVKEQERKEAENARETSELARDTAEQERIVNEEMRQTNEEERKASEDARKTNEDSRIEAESERQAYYTEIQEKVNRGDFNGEPNILSIGKVIKGEEAKATIEGDNPNQILNLVLPKGDKGDKGEQGDVSLEQMNQAIATAISGIQGFDYEIVDVLPDTGSKGIIYLMKNNGKKPNIYNEYIWINNDFEIIGTTEVDLSQYAKNEDVTTQINAIKTDLQDNITNNTSKITELEIDIQNTQNLVKDNIAKGTMITIPLEGWIKNEETQYYEYDVKDTTVTSNTKILGDLDIDNMNKINSRGYIDSYGGGYKIILADKPLDEITIDITKIKKQVV